MANLDNIKFGLRKGNRADLDRTPIATIGTFNVCKDTKELMMDLDGMRYPINSACFDYTEAQITALSNPSKKLYIAKDTFRVYIFDSINLRWLIIGENGIVIHADSADKDGSGRNIRETYFTKSEAEDYMVNTDASIQELENAIDFLNNYIVEIYDDESDLPEEGVTGTLYFVLDPLSLPDDPVYIEYIWVTDGYYVKIGSTSIDLHAYTTTATFSEAMDNVSSSMSSAVSRIEALESTASSMTSAIHDLEEVDTNHASSISDLENASSALGTRVEDLENTSTLMSSQISDNSDNISANASSISDILESISSIMSSISNMEAAIAIIQEQIGGSTGSSTASGIVSRIEDLESSMSIVSEVTASNLGKITDLEGSTVSLASSISDLGSSYSGLNSSALYRENEARDVELDFVDDTDPNQLLFSDPDHPLYEDPNASTESENSGGSTVIEDEPFEPTPVFGD